jgi:glycosyltransferase involved in cell wall biosynthesis
MANKRILIFSTAYLPLIGGAEISVKELTDRLGDEIEFDLITARLKRELPIFERVGKVNVYRIGVGLTLLDKLLVPFLGAAKAIQLNRVKHYSCFWCIMASFSSGAAYIANWFHKKVPIVLTLQEGDSEKWLKYRRLGLIDFSWRRALQRTDHLTGLSNYLLERARRLGYKGSTTLIPNGVDLAKFQAPLTSDHKNPGEVVLVTTSRLAEKNGVGDAIEALKFLPENIKFKIIGVGALEKSLKAKVKNLNLKNRVEFLGEIANVEVPNYLNQADIFVRPSLSEGQGISFIEAMAAGLPVIATPVGGIPDFLKDGETGLFVEPKSPRLIAFQVQKLINDRVLRDKITINAKRMVAEKYDWNLIAKDMKEKVFDKI